MIILYSSGNQISKNFAMLSLNIRTVASLLNMLLIVLMKTEKTFQTKSSKNASDTEDIDSLRKDYIIEETTTTPTVLTTTTEITTASTTTLMATSTRTDLYCHPSELNIDCCKQWSKCGEGSGHCNYDDECDGDLVCGQGNCGSQYFSFMNCCTYRQTTTSTTTTQINKKCGEK